MKPTRLVIVPFALLSLVMVASVSGQQPENEVSQVEQEIRTIDRAENVAVLANDLPAIEKLWAADFVVNAPNNQIANGRDNITELVKGGILDYVSFDRHVEAVAVHGDTAIVMGEETVRPKGKAPFAGQTVKRRFTNIWMKRDGKWQLTARQATIISVE
jgi:ketosteroid isomerase-like protein